MNTLNKVFLSKVVSVCFFVLITFIVAGCIGSGGDDGIGDGDGMLYVDASVSKGTMLPSGIMTFVEVSESGTPVDNATVRVNITPIPSAGSNGEYELFGTLVIDSGDYVTLDISHVPRRVGATLLMPELATISSPTAGGSPYGALSDIDITWNTFVTNPDI